ncbi:SET domain-containing protein [Sarocladium implicatum]|nr:SET domain-containing protein [Sarocladium implicatum]
MSPLLYLPGLSKVLIMFLFPFYSFPVSPAESAVFPVAARFNHACLPARNVEHGYDSDQDCLVLRVCVDLIRRGQEITITYGESPTPAMLYERWGFRCQCGACGGITDAEFEAMEPQW